MPPNTQNQIPPTQPGQPAPSNVPEYLHLDPVSVDVGPKKSKKIPIILAVVFLLISAVAAVVFVWLQSVPEQNFYAVLEKQLQVQRVTQTVTSSDADTGVETVINIATDYTDGALPKTGLKYAHTDPSRKIDTASTPLTLEGEMIITKPKGFYSKLTRFPKIETAEPIVADQWYEIPASDTNNAFLFDSLNLRSSAQSFVGTMPIGNFDQGQRELLMDFIKKNQIYEVEESRQESLNGKDATVYSIRTDLERLTAMHRKINEVAGIASPDIYTDSKRKINLTVWVDTVTGRVVQIEQKDHSDKGAVVGLSKVEIEYSIEQSIEQPQNTRHRNPR